ncbi:hypothetical protein EP7_005642 (plasmid) [Isosphaeraceae bacterium EP7]
MAISIEMSIQATAHPVVNIPAQRSGEASSSSEFMVAFGLGMGGQSGPPTC